MTPAEALNKQLCGLWVINGIDPGDDASDFFLGWLGGCSILLAHLFDEAGHELMLRATARCTPEELTKAMLMVQCFRASDPCPEVD